MFKLSDDEQFPQYQPNEQSLFISNHWTKRRPQYMALEI